MLMIFTALYCEGQPLIQHYHLTKDNSINKFQVFRNEDIVLTITGTGSIAAAVAVTYVCNHYPPAASDFLINIGVCSTGDHDIPEGSVFLCDKIYEEATNRSFYPDILFKHPFTENNIVTCSTIVRDFGFNHSEKLFDMEAAGIYQAAAYFFQPHQVLFFKIVSDYGMGDKVTPEKIAGLVEKNISDISAWLDEVKKARFGNKPVFNSDEETCIRNLISGMHCSVTMEYKLRQLLLYYKLCNGSITEAIEDFLTHYQLPCKTKAEGKMYLGQLRTKLV